MAESAVSLTGKCIVAVITFHDTWIYPTDAEPGQHPEHIVAADPHGHFQKIHHFGESPDGKYEDEETDYWREVTDALAPAGAILLLGRGKGKANASLTAGLLTRSATEVKWRPRCWPTSASTSTNWTTRRSSGWPSTTSMAPLCGTSVTGGGGARRLDVVVEYTG